MIVILLMRCVLEQGRESRLAPDVRVLTAKANWPVISGPSGNETNKYCRFVMVPHPNAPVAIGTELSIFKRLLMKCGVI